MIDSPTLFQDGGAYFTGVWRQAETSEPPGQPELLQALSNDPLALPDLVAATGLSPDAVTAALKTLCDHDVVIQEGDRLRFTVELMRRWVQQRS